MSFQEFEGAIVSASLRCVADHWNGARGAHLLPAWADIRPSKLVAHLPIIWSYKYDRDADTFTGRLAGSQIEQIFGKNFRGLPMEEVYPQADFARLFSRSTRVVSEHALYRGEGMIFSHVDHFGHGERIMMPLATDGFLGDGILGATEYKSVRGGVTGGLKEDESWFSL
jgi:hypothetical protein